MWPEGGATIQNISHDEQQVFCILPGSHTYFRLGYFPFSFNEPCVNGTSHFSKEEAKQSINEQ